MKKFIILAGVLLALTIVLNLVTPKSKYMSAPKKSGPTTGRERAIAPTRSVSPPAARTAVASSANIAHPKSGSLNQAQADECNRLEREWAASFNKAGPYISQGNYFQAVPYINNSLNAALKMRSILDKEGVDINTAPRILGMEDLSRAYLNLAKLLPMAGDPRLLTNNANELKKIITDTQALLESAEKRFSRVPHLQNLCRELMVALKTVSARIK